MKNQTLSVQPTASAKPYTNIHQVARDYYSGKPVLVRGYNELAGLTVDLYEANTLRSLGYSHLELCLGTETMEVAL
jgi:hypothetical protein